jgi:hypothetical protein
MMNFTLKTLLTILLLGPVLAPMGVHASMGHHEPNMKDCLEYCLDLMNQNASEQGVVVKVSDGGVAPNSLLIEVTEPGERYVSNTTISYRDIGLILKTQKRE